MSATSCSAQQIGLLHEIKEVVGRPFRIGEALVAPVDLRHRLDVLAGEPLGGRAEQFEIGAAEPRLQFYRARRVRQPILEHLAERLDHVGDFVGGAGLDLSLLARLEVGGERLAAALDHAGEVLGERLNVDRAELGGPEQGGGRLDFGCLGSCRHVFFHDLPPSKLRARTGRHASRQPLTRSLLWTYYRSTQIPVHFIEFT